NWNRLPAAAACRALAAVAIAALAATAVMPHSFAQQPPAKGPDPKAKSAPKGDPKQKGPQPQQGEQPPQLTYAPWTKVCQKPPEANSKRICFTGKDGRVEDGMPVVAAVLIEPEGEPTQ